MKKTFWLLAMALSLFACTGKADAEACKGQLAWFDIKGPAKSVYFGEANIELFFDQNGNIKPGYDVNVTVNVDAQGNGKVESNENVLIIKNGKLSEAIVTNIGGFGMPQYEEIRYKILMVNPQTGVPGVVLKQMGYTEDNSYIAEISERKKVKSVVTDKYGNWTELTFDQPNPIIRTIEYYAPGETPAAKPSELTESEMLRIFRLMEDEGCPKSKELTALEDQIKMFPYPDYDGYLTYVPEFDFEGELLDKSKFEVLDSAVSYDYGNASASFKIGQNSEGLDQVSVVDFIYEDGKWVLDDYSWNSNYLHGMYIADGSWKEQAKKDIEELHNLIRAGEWRSTYSQYPEIIQAFQRYIDKYMK